MPLTASGKINRAGLPASDAERPKLSTPFVAPQGPIEEKIAQIWIDLLEVTEVGRHDNFFDLGGDSIVMLRIALKIQQTFDVTVPPEFYDNPTIAKLASLLVDPPSVLTNRQMTVDTAQGPIADAKPQPDTKGRFVGKFIPKRRINRLLFLRGPYLYGTALPYAAGVKLQHRLLQQPVIRHCFFDRQIHLFRQALHDANLFDQHLDQQDDALIINLMSNTWTAWRAHLLRNPQIFARWVTVIGDEFVRAAVAQKRGLLIVFTHQASIGFYVRQHLTRYGIQDVPTISGKGTDSNPGIEKAARRTQSSLNAFTVLRQGGAVLIAGEGMGAGKPTTVSFQGRMLPLPMGFAELAQLSQSVVMAAHSQMTIDGHIKLVFTPLTTPASTSSADELFHEYVSYLHAQWSNLLPTMSWQRLAYLASLPPSDHTVRYVSS